MKPALVVLTALWLSACGSQVAGVSVPPAPQTPDQALFLAETDFDIALKQADVAPKCSATITTVCLTTAQVKQVYLIAAQGVKALGAAKTAVATYDAIASPTSTDTSKAVAAVAALVALVPQITALLPAAPSSS